MCIRDSHKEHTAELKREHTALENKLERLTDLRLDDELSKDEFIAQKNRVKARQYEITDLLHAYDKTDDEFINKLVYMVNLARNAVEEFRSSGFDEKRELLNYIFQNLEMDGKNLVYTMAKPFSIIADCNKNGRWCGREDSNFHGIISHSDLNAARLPVPPRPHSLWRGIRHIEIFSITRNVFCRVFYTSLKVAGLVILALPTAAEASTGS